MPERRTVLAAVSTLGAAFLTGCLNTVRGGIGNGGLSLSNREGDILDLYEQGIEKANAGTEAWNAAIPLLNESVYGDAKTKFETAIERYDEAQGLFSDAEQECRAVAQEEAARLCADAAERSGLMGEAATAGRDAAQAGLEGESKNAINEHIRTAQGKEEEASSIELREPGVLASTLNDG